MNKLRFDGKAAVVTGAGGNPGLGRAYALLLASRGANVVVNDIGNDPEAQGYTDTASAEAVAEEIRALGGNAVSDTNSVATENGAAAIIQTALDAFGSIDILINNAGICIVTSFEEITSRDIQRTIDINLMGTIWTCRAAWPHMRKKGYGRIVNITSSSIAGSRSPWQTVYAASKGGVFSLTRSLAAEGDSCGIKANSVSPAAFTRMVMANHMETSPWFQHDKDNLLPELASPVVAYLAHENCPVTGECIVAGGGNVKRFYCAQTNGFADPDLTIETVAEYWHDVLAGSAEGIVRLDALDPREWHIRPYNPAFSNIPE